MNESELKNYELKATYLDELGQTQTAKDLLLLIDEIRNLNGKIKKLNETLSFHILNNVHK